MAVKDAQDSPRHLALDLWTFQPPTVIEVLLRQSTFVGAAPLWEIFLTLSAQGPEVDSLCLTLHG